MLWRTFYAGTGALNRSVRALSRGAGLHRHKLLFRNVTGYYSPSNTTADAASDGAGVPRKPRGDSIRCLLHGRQAHASDKARPRIVRQVPPNIAYVAFLLESPTAMGLKQGVRLGLHVPPHFILREVHT